MSSIKVPPQNIEAEKSVLASILLDKDAIIKIAEKLKPNYFYDRKHELVYESILELYENRSPIDLITLTDLLNRKSNLKQVGGASYLADLVNFIPSAINVEYYADIVKENHTRRSLIDVASEIGNLGYATEERIDDIIDIAEQKLYNLSNNNIQNDFISVRESLNKAFELIDHLSQHSGELRGIPTGFKSLDSKLNGFRESNLIIIAARPSVGKSAFMTNIAQYAAVKHKIGVGIFSLEMSSDELVLRMLASQSGVDGFKLTSGQMKDDEMVKFGEAAGILDQAPIYIDDTPSITIMELRTKARRLQMDKGIKMIFVDYLQLMRGVSTRSSDTRAQEVSEISWGLKALAKELNIPVVALAQLNRGIETRADKKPVLSDLRESGSIEQDADVVMFLSREDGENRSDINLTIAKQRNGPTGEIPLYFVGSKTTFVERTKRNSTEDKTE